MLKKVATLTAMAALSASLSFASDDCCQDEATKVPPCSTTAELCAGEEAEKGSLVEVEEVAKTILGCANEGQILSPEEDAEEMILAHSDAADGEDDDSEEDDEDDDNIIA